MSNNHEDQTQAEDNKRQVLSRKSFLAAAGATGLAATLVACGGSSVEGDTAAASATTAANTDAATTGSGAMLGPTGFDGAEQFQYAEDSAPGRAVMAAKQLRMDGKAPEKLVVGMYAGAIPNFMEPFPEGAPSVSEVWEKETGIKIEWIPMDPAQTYAKNVQAAARKDGSQDIVVMGISENGDLANAGLLLDLSEFVEQYQPDWNDPVMGYAGGEPSTKLLNYYDGKPYSIGVDGDYQLFFCRSDLFEDSKEQTDFKAKYDYDLIYPETWEQQRDMAEFFYRPDKGLLGDTSLRSPFWCTVNFYIKYVQTANPAAFYWDDDMKPLINSEMGLKVVNDLLATLPFGSPDAASWIWEQQYGNWGERGAAMTSSFGNLSKFMKPGSGIDPKDAGSVTVAQLQPGYEIDGTLVRHTSISSNAAIGVNALAPTDHHEAAYLFGQWVSSGQIYTWVTGNPAGYEDPCKTYSLDNEFVINAYTPSAMEAYTVSIPSTCPPPSSMRGAPEYDQALDIELQKVYSGQTSPEQMLENVSKEWDKITDKIGREEQARVWVASKAGWSTIPNTLA